MSEYICPVWMLPLPTEVKKLKWISGPPPRGEPLSLILSQRDGGDIWTAMAGDDGVYYPVHNDGEWVEHPGFGPKASDGNPLRQMQFVYRSEAYMSCIWDGFKHINSPNLHTYTWQVLSLTPKTALLIDKHGNTKRVNVNAKRCWYSLSPQKSLESLLGRQQWRADRLRSELLAVDHLIGSIKCEISRKSFCERIGGRHDDQ